MRDQQSQLQAHAATISTGAGSCGQLEDLDLGDAGVAAGWVGPDI